MKKIYEFLIALVAIVSIPVQAQDNALFVYRNDGSFNAFFRETIDSISLSHFDLDSIRHDVPACQVFFTPDSVYRIPIEAIDSVSFVAPKTILQPGVIALEGNLREALIKAENERLLFKKGSQNYHHFKIGEKLVSLEMSDIFPTGFKGEVIEVGTEDENILIVCKDVEMEEVFHSYSCAINSQSKESTNRNNQIQFVNDRNFTFEIPSYSKTWDLSGFFDILPNNKEFGTGACLTTTYKPKFTIKGWDLVDPERGRIIDVNIVGEYDVENSYDFSVEISKRKEASFFPEGKVFETPLVPFLSFFFDAGLFLEGSAKISFKQMLNSTCISTCNIKLLDNSFEMPKFIFKETGRSCKDYKLALKGRVAGGVYVELGIKPSLLDKKWSKASFSVDCGVEFESINGFDFEDLKQASFNTILYDAVNIADGALPNNFNLGLYAAAKFNAKLSSFEFNWTFGKWALGEPIYQGGLFPHFSNLGYKRNGNLNEINCYCSTSRNCLFNYELGFAVFDSEGNKLKTVYYPTLYSSFLNKNFDKYDIDISGIEKSKNYVIHPCIKVFGFDVLASPSIKVSDNEMVEISDFKVTSSEHQENGFSYDDITYSYKFNTSVTLTLKDSQGVEDWGYVYRDPYGKDKLISLKEFGFSYTDDRYAYYRDSSPSTVTLFGYVKYLGDNEYYFDELQYFEMEHKEDGFCEDENHVHMVDLGLSVKWACCNIGANFPEEYGSYFAWGETDEKSDYSLDTYEHWVDKDKDGAFDFNEVKVTTDIAGLNYDVAHVRLGGNWRLPRNSEIVELVQNCNWQWINENGVCGYKVTGPNGNSIFLPAAGNFVGTTLHDEDTCGYYWSSTPMGFNLWGACFLNFDSKSAEWKDAYWRSRGFSVRPVSD